jgi:cell division protein FtsZ
MAPQPPAAPPQNDLAAQTRELRQRLLGNSPYVRGDGRSGEGSRTTDPAPHRTDSAGAPGSHFSATPPRVPRRVVTDDGDDLDIPDFLK